MQRISLLLTALFALASAAMAQSDTQTATFRWAHSVDGVTSAGDNVISAKTSTNGDFYIATTFGSTDVAPYVYFDGTVMLNAAGDTIKGDLYDTNTGNSNNGNLLLQRIDTLGNVKWTAYTCRGDIDQSNSHFIPTADDGLLAVVKSRAWIEKSGYQNLVEYIDPTGTSYLVTDSATTKSEYRYTLLKLSAEGKVEWSRIISGLLRTDLSYTTYNTIYVCGAAVDADGNFYLADNYRTQLIIPKEDGSTATFTASNTSGWTGDSQDVVGDLFLIKLDSNGYYLNSLLASGTASCAFIDNIAYNDGKLFFNGRVKGDGTTMTLGGRTIDASSDFQTVITGAINSADLSVDYLSSVTSVANSSGKFTVQNKNAQYFDGTVYFTGLLNGGWRRAGETSDIVNTSSTVLKGYILAMSASDGSITAAAISDTTVISGYYGIYYGDKYIYAHGYEFDATNKGAILTVHDKSTLAAAGAKRVMCSYGTVAVCGTPTQSGEYFVMLNRGGKSNSTTNSAAFYGTSTTFTNLTAWGGVYYCYSMADVAELSGITAATADETAPCSNCDVYSISGLRLKTAATMQEATQGLPAGLYIIGNKKVAITR